MIRLNRLNGDEIVVNPELIEWVEATPDTTVTLATGSKILVQNSISEVIDKVMAYRKALAQQAHSPAEILLKNFKKI